ncbi:MAG: superoxide dismutase family protein [Pseudomonadota bacterium]
MQHRSIAAVLLTLALAGCASAPPPKPAAPAPQHRVQRAAANMAPASASLVSGRLTLSAIDGGVRIQGELGGLGKGGTHAIHVHERGDCTAADGSAAGGHFNPTGVAHGRAGIAPHHLGDMDNLHAGGDGVANVDIRLLGVTLGSGAANDILGRAIIVHAGPDDYAGQPAGNAGARVACGVIEIAP